jgi:hypothetical protein
MISDNSSLSFVAFQRWFAPRSPACCLLLLAERLVHQRALARDHLPELLERLRRRLLLAGHLPAAGHLHIFEHVLQLRQQLLRRRARALLRQILNLIEHRLQILRAHDLPAHPLRHRALAFRVFGHSLKRAFHRRAQAGHQGLDLRFRCASRQSVHELLLNGAQFLLRKWRVAFFDLQRHIPQKLLHRRHLGAAARARHHVVSRAQAQIDALIRREPLRRDRKRVKPLGHVGCG